ncbi:MAG: hypothetical protein B6D39_10635 [Anaerolineae bacterium UTCFX2]|jgi:pSer/pThr/pTyr-binding forkhead associated (FHA) protein|nr:FHA domain-containing protein [Anaerolineae bacterium]MCZ7551648.1 FHA domain-containing protein [Anaerolineales bacterium]OQY88895.1 MAG: hypothetical protein B6D39_10635 [Anaerolineae bacterium UTCFX2]
MELAILALRALMLAALYGFLGWAFWLLWQGLQRQSQKTGAAQLPALTLFALDGGEGEPQRFAQPEISVGRQPGSDLRLADSAVSARHARLTYHHSQWWVEDLLSRNGTFLNGERLTTPLVLADGDEVRFGGLLFRVEIENAPALAEL